MMKKLLALAGLALSLLLIPGTATTQTANSYNAARITHLSSNADGRLYIKWPGSPRPGPCGTENYGWVTIQPSADRTIKALALGIYLHGLPARVDTVGCDGRYEIVASLYSPSG